MFEMSTTPEGDTSSLRYSTCVCAECKVTNFGLQHCQPRLFIVSQWPWPEFVYIIYRFVWVAYLVVWISLSGEMRTYPTVAHWFIYITHQGFLVLVLDGLWRLALAIAQTYITKSLTSVEGDTVMPWHLKVHWVMHNIASNTALFITLLYWSLIYRGGRIDGLNFSFHAMNSVFVVVDMFMSATPVRLLHCYHTILAGIYYSIFSAIYYAAGGTDKWGRPFIYRVMDWGRPGRAILVCALGCFVGIPLMWTLLFGLYKLRLYIFSKIYREERDYDLHNISRDIPEC